MTNISQILQSLNKINKIKGSMVITTEGIIISSEINIDVDKDRLSAFCSDIGLSITNSLNKIESKPFLRYIINSDKWKLCFINIGKSYLIVISEVGIDITTLNVELYRTADLLKKTGRLE